MICYNCDTPTDTNMLAACDDDEYDYVVDSYMLVHCDGTDDQFDADGNVVICKDCVLNALAS